MEGYREVTKNIDVPPNTGIDGFMRTLRQILRKPRVQQVVINARGRVSYSRYVRDGEPEETSGFDFDDLQPYFVIRNSDLQELLPPETLSAAAAICMMFDRVAQDRLYPIAFVAGAESSLWDWYQYTTGHIVFSKKQLFGLPVLIDRQVPDSALILCAGFGRDASLIDTQISYKVEIPVYTVPDTSVEVIP